MKENWCRLRCVERDEGLKVSELVRRWEPRENVRRWSSGEREWRIHSSLNAFTTSNSGWATPGRPPTSIARDSAFRRLLTADWKPASGSELDRKSTRLNSSHQI